MTKSRLEKELSSILRDEYSLYKLLHTALRQQLNSIRSSCDENLTSLFNEIKRCHQRIKQFEGEVASLKEAHPQMFGEVAASSEVKKLVSDVVTMVKKIMSLASEDKECFQERYERIRQELDELKRSLQHVGDEEETTTDDCSETKVYAKSSVKEKPLWRKYLGTVMLALFSAILLRLFVVSSYRVFSCSMEDTVKEGDSLFVNKLAYSFGNGPEIGDIVVFIYPNNPSKNFIKRIVALPGQTVEVRDKIVFVDNVVVDLPPKAKNTDGRVIPGDLSFRDNFGPYEVPLGEYFVMGDNRDDSHDSRFWGSVPAENIRGKAVIIYWSWQPDFSDDWSFPYADDAAKWAYNFLSRVRWSRIGNIL